MIKTLFSGLLTILVLFGALAQPEVALGQEEDSPYGYLYSQQEINEYRAAINNCETPSLECLVRHVVRFTAIEISNEVVGEDHALGGGGGEAPNVNTPNPGPGGDSGGGGVIGSLFNFIGDIYSNPPASSTSYVADVVNSAGFASPAYAQGLGFASLDPILDLWKAFRNIAYFFFILFFIVIGIMIMFRFKIGGQSAITAQQAIPSVLISLILVTFSYAIAGFMIDLMYLSMFMVMGLFTGLVDLTPTFGAGASLQSIMNMNIFDIGGSLFASMWRQLGETGNLIDSIVTAAHNSTSGAIAGFVGGITLTLVLSIAVLIGVFRLFFELLKSYFSIILAVVTAPLILMIGALPGRDVFWPWLKNIVGNLVAFPAVLLIIIMFAHFTGSGTGNAEGGFIPPFLFGDGQAGMIGPLLGLATILALPELIKKIKEAAGATDSPLGALVLSAVGKRLNEGEIGLPAVPGAVGYASGGIRGLVEARKQKASSVGDYWRYWQHGGLPGDAPVGGGARWGGRGVDAGMRVRRTIDQIKEGRFADPQNTENLLQQIADNQRRSQTGGSGGASGGGGSHP